MTDETQKNAQATNQSAPKIYTIPPPGLPNLARDNSIRVLFHGLQVSNFAADGSYLVKAYNGPASGGSHAPSLQVWKRNPKMCVGNYVYGTHFNQDTPIILEVSRPLPAYGFAQ